VERRGQGAHLHWVVGSNPDGRPHSPPNIVDLHRGLIVDIATAYLEENAVWGAPTPIEFVREYLSNDVNFDPLTATWLFLQDELARTELANGLAARISLMVASRPQIMDTSQVSLGPVVESLSVGGVILRGQYVDAIYGDSRLVSRSCEGGPRL